MTTSFTNSTSFTVQPCLLSWWSCPDWSTACSLSYKS